MVRYVLFGDMTRVKTKKRSRGTATAIIAVRSATFRGRSGYSIEWCGNGDVTTESARTIEQDLSPFVIDNCRRYPQVKILLNIRRKRKDGENFLVDLQLPDGKLVSATHPQ